MRLTVGCSTDKHIRTTYPQVISPPGIARITEVIIFLSADMGCILKWSRQITFECRKENIFTALILIFIKRFVVDI